MTNINFHILRHESLPSTNTEAMAQARRGAPEGLVIVAAEQTSGRGRHGRVWASPKESGLYLSIVLRPRFAIAKLSFITLLAALAVRDALRSAAKLEADIKWSNDVLAGERKLCGILAERIETSAGACVVLGIGINLRRAALPPELVSRATSIEEETGVVPDADVLLRELLAALRRRYEALHAEGGERRLLEEFAESSSYVEGRRVRVHSPSEEFEGTTRGLAEDGALRVELPGGEIRVVHAGDIVAVRAVGDDAA